MRDESDRTGMRLVIILKQDAQPKKVLNALYKHTQMQQTFGVNALALVEDGRQPRLLTLKRMLQAVLERRQPEVQALLARYRVPLVETPVRSRAADAGAGANRSPKRDASSLEADEPTRPTTPH